MEEELQQNNNEDPVNNCDDNGSEEGVAAKMRKIFGNRKSLSPAERKRLERERKSRQLRRLRKLLTPKNAIVALHELQGQGMSEFTITTNGQETTAEVTVNNVRYEASAANKTLAKCQASEKALRDLVINQITKVTSAANKQQQSSTNGDESEDVEMTDVSEEDEVPMLHLASFALYKLFNEWQNQGFDIPALKPPKPAVVGSKANDPSAAKPPKVTKTIGDLPADAASRHPTSLLAFMRPQLTYEDLGSNNSNNPATQEFTVGVTVDGQRFIGKGRSKKLARKEAASTACRTLFKVNFVEAVA